MNTSQSGLWSKRWLGSTVCVAEMYEILRIHRLQEEGGRIYILEPIFQAETLPMQNFLDISGDHVAYFSKKISSILVQYV